MDSSPVIRPGVLSDIPAVHRLVRELAIWERSEEHFVASVEEYERDFKADRFRVLVSEVNGKVVGMAFYFWAYSTWKGKMLFLEDFVVEPSYRRFGLGQLLFDAFLELAKKEDCRLVKWQVLDWNEIAVKFYQKNEAIIEKDWWNCKIFFPENPKKIATNT